MCSLWTPIWLCTNGLWAWHISLLRDREPSQHRLLISFEGKLFFFRPKVRSCVLLSGHQIYPQVSVFRHHRGVVRVLPYSTKQTSCNHTAHISCGLDPLAIHCKGLDPLHSVSPPAVSKHRTTGPDVHVSCTQWSTIMHWFLSWKALICLLTLATLMFHSTLHHGLATQWMVKYNQLAE